jgi:hypothetical protein
LTADRDGVVVLGMGRSGTSATASMFARAGFFAGREDELLGATDANPLGYYENLGLVMFNHGVLEQLGGTWFDPPAVDRQLTAGELLRTLVSTELARIVAAASGAPVVIKDPRIGVLLPIWGPALSERLHPVLVVRDPIEVALSLRRRDGTPLAAGLAAWEIHMSAVVQWLRGRPCTVAPYAAMLERPALASELVAAAAAHLRSDRGRLVRAGQAAEALCADLRRERGGELSLMSPAQRRLWQLLAALPAGHNVLAAPALDGR